MLLIVIALLCSAPRAQAADPQPYKVDIASTGDSALNTTLKATSELETLRKTAPVGPFGLIGRARGDLERLKTVLESFGYYQSYVEIRIDGLPLDDPGVGEALNARSKDNDSQIKITFSLGPMYHLRKVEIDGQVPAGADKVLALNAGAPAIAADVLAGGDRLLNSLEDQGYAFAKVDTPIAQEIPAERVLDVSFHVETGARVQIGDIRIRGLKDVKEAVVRKRLLVHSGEQYGATKIENARKDLLAMGVFASVSVRLGTKPDSQGRIPITFTARERQQHAVSLSGAYSSDLGGSTGVSWTKRNVSGKADLPHPVGDRDQPRRRDLHQRDRLRRQRQVPDPGLDTAQPIDPGGGRCTPPVTGRLRPDSRHRHRHDQSQALPHMVNQRRRGARTGAH